MSLTLPQIDNIALRAAGQAPPGSNVVDRSEVLALCYLSRDWLMLQDQVRDMIKASEAAILQAASAAEDVVVDGVERKNLKRKITQVEAALLQRQEWLDTMKRTNKLNAQVLARYCSLIKRIEALSRMEYTLNGAEARAALADLYAETANNASELGPMIEVDPRVEAKPCEHRGEDAADGGVRCMDCGQRLS